jgi:hypothetical protein
MCNVPFSTLYVLHNHYATCCPTWLDSLSIVRADVGQQAAEIWNASPFKVLRLAWETANERAICAKCPLYATGTYPQRDASEPQAAGPKRIYLANEARCNLHCWTCRKSTMTTDPDEYGRERRMREIVFEFLPGLEWLSLLHTGELFASPMHLRLLQDLDVRRHPECGVEIFTNGILLPQSWCKIDNVHSAVRQITISIDAAWRKTYELVRAPAKWDQIQKSLHFVKWLRDSGRVDFFQCNFVARRANFREIIPFAKMCQSFGATMVRYSIFDRSWMSEADYASEIPYSEPEFAEIVNSPELDRPDVNVSILRAAAEGRSMSA